MTDRKLVELARARYPDMLLLLAVNCFESDRRRAGLGALGSDRRKRFGAIGYSHKKYIDLFDGRVFYRSTYRRNEQLRYKPMLPMDYVNYSQTTTIETERLPSVNEVRVMPIDNKYYRTQEGRSRVAQCLRALRKEIRTAAKAVGA